MRANLKYLKRKLRNAMVIIEKCFGIEMQSLSVGNCTFQHISKSIEIVLLIS